MSQAEYAHLVAVEIMRYYKYTSKTEFLESPVDLDSDLESPVIPTKIRFAGKRDVKRLD